VRYGTRLALTFQNLDSVRPMIKTLRTKMLLGITPLLAIMIGLGLWGIFMFFRLGNRIDVILKENYRSVLAAQGMKESLERIDSSLLFAIGGEEQQAREQYQENRPKFDHHYNIERGNVTLPGEQALVDALTALRARYFSLTEQFFARPPKNKDERTRLYFTKLLPTFNEIKREADLVLDLNQTNMEVESNHAREAAASSTRLMIVILVVSAGVGTLIAIALSRSILEPIDAVTRGARAMARGELDQVVPATTQDELGELANAFNVMARTIREFQQAGTARLLRAQQTAQATIDSFPDPVVVMDPAGAIERANPAARRILHVEPTNGSIPWIPPAVLKLPVDEVLRGHPDHLPTNLEHALAFRDDGQERYFLPHVLAIRDDRGSMLGAAVVLQDVTKFRLVDQLKSDMVSTVSHELKTPLTSVQMAIHLLLEEAVGPLNSKQIELLLAARQDSGRLLAMVNDLLDLTRIEQGRVRLDLRRSDVADLVLEAKSRFAGRAEDLAISLEIELASGLPAVLADRDRVDHVFDNLIGNALDHTPRGGRVRLSVEGMNGFIQFSVSDSGEGIPPEHLPRIFEKFYRVPGSRRGGAGLGLAIAREIVSAHGGQIEVTSRVGQGTTFRFTLPEAPTHDGQPAREGERP
jgi:two-component system, NtrC family, sensor histidine kinase KinB